MTGRLMSTMGFSLADVLIKQLTGHNQKTVWDIWEDPFCDLRFPSGTHKTIRNMAKDPTWHLRTPTRSGERGQACRISPIGQLRPRGPPAVLEGDQASVVAIRATEIELANAIPFSFLDRTPEQVVHSSEIVEPLVGASILVDEHVLEG